MLGIFYRFVISGTSSFNDIIVIFRIGFESDVGITISAFKIKSEDFNTEIDLIIADFHSHVELSSDVKIVGTSIAPETHW